MHIDINLDVERPRLHAVQFSALVKHYLAERARHLDPATIKNYRIRLNKFLRWWQMVGPMRDWMLDEESFAAYSTWIRGAPALGWWSQHDALRRVRQVLRWAHRRGYVSVDFSEFVPGMRGNAPPRVPVGLEVLHAMLQACNETREPERNRAMLAVLAGTGVRCEECAALCVENVLVYEDGTGTITLPVAKNDKLRTVAFDSLTATYLCEWIVMLPYGKGPLFPSRNGRNSTPLPLTVSGLHKIFDKIADLADVTDDIHGPHDLRRMFATIWLRQLPGHINLLQKQMGHSSIATTLIYDQSNMNDVREAMGRKPVSPISVLASRTPPPRKIHPQEWLTISSKTR